MEENIQEESQKTKTRKEKKFERLQKLSKFEKIKIAKDVIKQIKTRAPFRLKKVYPAVVSNHQSVEEKIAIAETVAQAKGIKFNPKELTKNDIPETLEPTKARYDSNELMVITKTKKLLAYILTVMQKSPKYFRQTLVFRIQNYALDALEHIVKANTLKADTQKNKIDRKAYQHQAYVDLKLLEYMSFIALENGCILKKQYLQIAVQLADSINLLVAWTKKT